MRQIIDKIGVVSGLPGALYSICCLGVSTILESEKIVTICPTNDLLALTRKGSRGVGALFYPVTGRNEHACMLLIYLLVKLYELQER